ncbi:MAG: SNARE binding protein Sly1 [Amphiamblys sp. WSBS2006]|nr:MAG: SNARE binding protein Sly1 [Amphiamblys sp. WSBS2006]
MLRERQKKRIRRILKLPGNEYWKILVFDEAGQRILAPLFTVRDLRLLGVTVHAMLHSAREQVADVPGVYIVLPTEENIRRIVQDIKREVYGAFHVFFIEEIDAEKLSFFAEECVRQAVCYEQIEQVCDGFVGFVALEESVFSLGRPGMFQTFHSAASTEREIGAAAESICEGLASVLSVLSAKNVSIRFARDTPAELVARKLEARLQRLVVEEPAALNVHVCVLDRAFDIATPLRHVAEYNALVHDLFGVQNNVVRYSRENKMQSFDIEEDDWLWRGHSKAPFSETVEEIGRQFSSYREEELKTTGTEGGLEGKMTEAVERLPQLLEKKRVISGHLKLSESVIAEMERRKMDCFLSLEQRLGECSEEEVLKVLREESYAEGDRVRLAVLYVLCKGSTEKASLVGDVFRGRSGVFRYVGRLLSLSGLQPGEREAAGFLRSFVSSVKTFLPEKSTLPLTKKVVQYGQQMGSDELATLGSYRARPDILVVFVVGGTTYSEWNNLHRELSKTCRNLILGSTEMLSAESFLDTLEACS